MYKIENEKPKALVLHCSDPRFQQGIRKYLKDELGVPHYIPIVVGGGAHSLGNQTALPDNFDTLWDQIKFFLEATGLKQVVIINHQDCKWYQRMEHYHPDIELSQKGKLDLGTAAKLVAENFPDVEVKTIWAGIEDDEIVFSEVK